MDAPDPFSRSLRETLGDPALGGDSPEELVKMAEERIKEEADAIAKARGFADADDVFSFVRDAVGEDGREKIDAALDKDFDLSFFRDLTDRAVVSRGAAAQEAAAERGGFADHNSFVEASEKATSARLSGQPDHALELKISNTSDSIIAGQGE